MIGFLHQLDITPTIPITALTLERHPEFRTELGTVDPAVHGYCHVAYAAMTPGEQERDLDSARRVFASHGLPTRGFRAPYLAANETTRHLLSKAGFLYDSSTPRFVIPRDDELFVKAQRVAALRYGDAIEASIPVRVTDGVVELPVALPDDEILVDGLGVTSSATIARVLDRMVDTACEERFPLVLQMHPERFSLFAEALKRVAKRAADLGAWQATLSQIAGRTARAGSVGSSPFAFAITGDLDAATLWDFAPRLGGRL
jgi:peptidoglycan/xylan/chitin deacetylase (PgdA/CDA1 family)